MAISLLTIRGRNITDEVVHRVSMAMKPGDIGGTVEVKGEEYFWESFSDSPIMEAN